LLKKLGQREFSSILVEGGATLITSLIQQELVDRFVVILAPKIMGKGIDTVGDLGISDVERALKLSLDKAYRSGEDLVIEARPEVDRR